MSYPTPNLLLSTTYALNASNSKKIVIGLEWHGGLFRPVVKFIGGNSPASVVTLDEDAWEFFTHQQEPIEYYFSTETEQMAGRPTTFNINSAQISLTRCYGSKSILISQLPSPPVRDVRYEEKFDAQLPDDAARFEVSSAKKQKTDNPPSIAMQVVTYYGLRDLTRCVDLRMVQLEEHAVLVNRVVDQIIEFLKEEVGKKIDAEIKNRLINYSSFKQYFSSKRKEMYNRIFKSLNFFNLSQNIFELIFEEIYAFGLHPIARYLYNELCEK